MKNLQSKLILIILTVSLASCGGTKTYHLKCDSTVPSEYAQSIQDRTYVEGENVIYGDDSVKVLITIKNGKIAGYKLNDHGTITMMDTKKGGGGSGQFDECSFQYGVCIGGCIPHTNGEDTPGVQTCLNNCKAQYAKCRAEGLGSFLGGIGIVAY